MGLECNNDFRSTAFQFREFTESLVWQDILQELSNWENRIMEELAAPTFDPNTGQMVMGKSERGLYDEMLRGSLKALDHMRMIPTIILEIIEQKLPLEPQHDEGNDEFEFDE